MIYTCYGLTIASDLALPELMPSTSDPAPTEPDVRIRLAPVSPDGLPEGQQLGPLLWVTENQLWLHVPDVARYLVSDGTSVVIDAAPGVPEDSIRVFLLGSAIGGLLFQRGHLVLHGNAIRIGDACMVCVGRSGAGKSTLAAGFTQRGYDMLADDVVPVDGECRALPGFPRIKIWQDVAGKLGIDTTPLRRIRPDLEKFHYPLHERFANQPLPIRWIYALTTDHVTDIEFVRIRGVERFQLLRNNTYRVRLLEGMALKDMTLRSEHLQLCSRLADRALLKWVTRPQQGFDLDTLVDRMLADMAAHP